MPLVLSHCVDRDSLSEQQHYTDKTTKFIMNFAFQRLLLNQRYRFL